MEGVPQRGRGRPRKYPPKSNNDFESTKYENFFKEPDRIPKPGETVDIKAICNEVYVFLFNGQHSDTLFSKPGDINDISILKNLLEGSEQNNKPKNERTCDEVFYEYLNYYKDKANANYLSLLIKFVLLFRECYNISKAKGKAEEDRKIVTDTLTPEALPDLCNEFYGEFMEPNQFFGITEPAERNEIIEIIQHFCIWLFKNDYTKSKLSLAN